jgi:phosphohistidine phosphatase
MELYFLRHGIAALPSKSRYPDDRYRPLTKRGAARMRRIAKGMRRLNLEFDLILSSPYLRAKQTAEIAADTLGAEDNLKFSEHLAADAVAKRLVAELLKFRSRRKRILLVGHEPYISALISTLIAGRADMSLTMKKGGLCKLTLRSIRYGTCARLEWLLTPRHLVRIGK